jgi:hypothetical protein
MSTQSIHAQLDASRDAIMARFMADDGRQPMSESHPLYRRHERLTSLLPVADRIRQAREQLMTSLVRDPDDLDGRERAWMQLHCLLHERDAELV